MVKQLIGYNSLAFCINSNTMVFKKHSTLVQSLSVRPYTNNYCEWNICQYSTSCICCCTGYRIGTYFISHIQQWFSNIIYRDIKTQDDCLRLQQDIDAAARWEADWLMAFHPNKCTNLSVSPPKKNPRQNKTKQIFRNNYIFHNHIRDSVASAKYLDIT